MNIFFKYLILYVLITKGFYTYSQNCFYSDLSNEFSISTKLKTIENIDGIHDSSIVIIEITNKKDTTTTYKIQLSSIFFMDQEFTNCGNIRSYSIENEYQNEVIDNDYGDLIIADFNFDNKDDIALIRDSGGNGGPLYNFYIQSDSFQFKLDFYLSNNVIYFPQNIDQELQELKTIVHANAYQMCETIYSYNKRLDKWIIKNKKYIE